MKTLLLSIFLVICNISFAQPRVITFDSEQEKDEGGLEKNVVKLSLFELASGDLPIYYERVLSDMFSVEASVGVTFGDYIGSMFSDVNSSPFDESIDAKYGYSLSAAVRFYPIAVLEEFYVSPEFKFRKYNWDREVYYAATPPTFQNPNPEHAIHMASESRSYVMPRITLGYAFFYDNNLIFDWQIGIGMNTPTKTAYQTKYDDQYPNISIKGDIEEVKQKTRPRIHLGFKIGYVF